MYVEIEHGFESPGPHELSFRLAGIDDEELTHNNRKPVSVEVADDPIDILHIEGEPRFEVKFVRRAAASDGSLRVVSLIHTSDSKLYRLGVDSADELKDGFPDEKSALFEFEAIVMGSYPASRISTEQMNLLRDFVAIRGGGLLALGGRLALGEGGWV